MEMSVMITTRSQEMAVTTLADKNKDFIVLEERLMSLTSALQSVEIGDVSTLENFATMAITLMEMGAVLSVF
jgi:hypothetical protein